MSVRYFCDLCDTETRERSLRTLNVSISHDEMVLAPRDLKDRTSYGLSMAICRGCHAAVLDFLKTRSGACPT